MKVTTSAVRDFKKHVTNIIQILFPEDAQPSRMRQCAERRTGNRGASKIKGAGVGTETPLEGF